MSFGQPPSPAQRAKELNQKILKIASEIQGATSKDNFLSATATSGVLQMDSKIQENVWDVVKDKASHKFNVFTLEDWLSKAQANANLTAIKAQVRVETSSTSPEMPEEYAKWFNFIIKSGAGQLTCVLRGLGVSEKIITSYIKYLAPDGAVNAPKTLDNLKKAVEYLKSTQERPTSLVAYFIGFSLLNIEVGEIPNITEDKINEVAEINKKITPEIPDNVWLGEEDNFDPKAHTVFDSICTQSRLAKMLKVI